MAENAAGNNKIYTFSDFTLDTSRGALSKDGVEISLRPQSFDVLRVLVSRAGKLVTREELQQAVWGHKVVTDDSLTHCLTDIRKALDDDNRLLLRTVPRRGVILETSVTVQSAPDATEETPRHTNRILAFAAAGIAALVVIVFFANMDSGRDAEAAEKSIAVLPFESFSDDPAQRYFSDGLTEEILNSLAKTPDLLVTARTSSFAYRDTKIDVPTIAAALGVNHILEGSVRRSGDRLRVTAQLIRARDGFHLWTETYDSTSTDIITMQEDIAVAIANALDTAMDPEELAMMMRVGTRSVPAYEAYLSGSGVMSAANNDSSLRAEGADWFEQAIALDPNFTWAHDRLFWYWRGQLMTNNQAYLSSGLSYDEIKLNRDEALANAIATEKDEDMRLKFQAHKAWVEFQPKRALQLVDEFFARNPELRTGRHFRILLLVMLGMQEEADNTVMRSYGQEKLRPGEASRWLDALEFSQNTELMVAVANDALELYSHRYDTLYRAHHVFLNAGEYERAAAIMPELLNKNRLKRRQYLITLRQACAEGRTADAERIYAEALEALPDDLSLNWLSHMIMGNKEAAEPLFREFDERGEFETMYTYLYYPNFDAKVYPNFARALSGQGVLERPIRQLPYRCGRNG